KSAAVCLDASLEERPEKRFANFASVLKAMSKIKLPSAPKPPKAKQSPRWALVVIRGRHIDAEHVLREGRNVLGRVGTGIDLEDQEPPDLCHISREHCAVHLDKGQLSIEDLGSANGTFVNRNRIKQGDYHPLKADDLIQVGSVVLKVRG